MALLILVLENCRTCPEETQAKKAPCVCLHPPYKNFDPPTLWATSPVSSEM